MERNKQYFKLVMLIPFLVFIVYLYFHIREFVRPAFLIVAILVSAVFSYTQAVFKSPFDVSPVFFFMIIISIKYGFIQSLFFVLLSSLIPAALAGGEVGLPSFLFFGSFAIQSFIAKELSSYPIAPLGVALAIANLILGYFITRFVGWEGGFFNSIINCLMNIIYFIQFGNFLINYLL